MLGIVSYCFPCVRVHVCVCCVCRSVCVVCVCRSVVQLEMEEVGQKAACAHLQATLERLGAREAELKSAFVELQKKHSQIKAFSKQVVRTVCGYLPLSSAPPPVLCPSQLLSTCCVVRGSFVLHTH